MRVLVPIAKEMLSSSYEEYVRIDVGLGLGQSRLTSDRTSRVYGSKLNRNLILITTLKAISLPVFVRLICSSKPVRRVGVSVCGGSERLSQRLSGTG